MGPAIRSFANFRHWLRCVVSLSVNDIETGYRQKYERCEYETSNPFHSSTSYETLIVVEFVAIHRGLLGVIAR
jgi:hypothetical protein